MRKILVLAVAAGLALGACDGGVGPFGKDEDACEQIADETIKGLDEMLEQVEDLTLEQLFSGEAPGPSDDFERRMDDLDRRAEEEGCSDERMAELLEARAGEIDAEGMFADIIRQGLQDPATFDELTGGGEPGGEDGEDGTAEGPGTRSDPVPKGQSARVGNWTVKVVSATPDATAAVVAENEFNDPPEEGRQFFMVGVEATYEGGDDEDESATLFELDFEAVGQSAVAYTSSDDCGQVPDELDEMRDVFTGGTLAGNVCWSVESADAASLVMSAEPFFGDPVFFSLA